MTALKGHFFNQKREYVTGRSPIYSTKVEEIVHPNLADGKTAVPAL